MFVVNYNPSLYLVVFYKWFQSTNLDFPVYRFVLRNDVAKRNSEYKRMGHNEKIKNTEKNKLK